MKIPPQKRTYPLFMAALIVSSIFVCSFQVEGEDEIGIDGSGPEDLGRAVHSQAKLMKKVPDVSQRTQTANGDERTLIEHEGSLYFIYAWFNSSASGNPITVSVISSPDGGENWTDKIDLWSSTFYEDCIWKGLFIWKGDLYAFYSAFHSTRTYRTCYMKKTSVDDWKGLRTASQTTISSIQAHSWNLAYDDDYIYLSMIRASLWRVCFYRYDGSSWSSETVLSQNGGASQSAITAVERGGNTKLLLFYHRPYSPGYSSGYVYMRTSTNNGNSWSSPTKVMDQSNTYSLLSVLNINGTVLLFAARKNNDDINIIISQNGGTSWTNEKTIISSRGLSTLQNTDNDFSVNTRANGRVVCLAYEGNPDEINMIYSKDWGSNWISESNEITLHSPDSFDPILADDVSYLSCTIENGTDWDSYLIDLTEVYIDETTPRNLTAQADYFTVDLEWDPPKQEAFGSYTFRNYKVYRGTSKRSMSVIATLGNITSYQDVIPSYENITYYYQVISTFSSVGESAPSNTVSSKPLVSSPPTDLTASAGDLSIDISWGTLDQEVTNLFPLEHYNVYRGRYPDALHKRAEVIGNSYQDTDIDNYPSTYYYRVSYTLGTIGESGLSEIISAVPNTSPGPPTDLTYDEIDQGVNIKWKPPLEDGCCPILSYNVYRGEYPQEMELIANLEGALNIDQTGMEPGSSYYYSITALNRLGESKRTEPILVNYLGVSSAPENLMATGKEDMIELKWSCPRVTWDITIDSYYIYRGTDTRGTELYQTVDGDTTDYTDFVNNGIDYVYEVSALNRFGESQRAGPVTERASTVPGQVTETSVSVGNRTVFLEWEPPLDNGGAVLTHYTIYRSQDPEDLSKLLDMPVGSGTYIDLDLTNGETYYYSISASNLNGKGELSEPISASPGTAPSAVRSISASPLLYSIRLNWEMPEEGGRDITGFRIYRGDSFRSLRTYMEIEPDQDSATQQMLDKELTYGERYFYAVVSENNLGISSLSPIVSATPYGAPSEPGIYDLDADLDRFSVYWKAPDDDGRMPIQGYRFYYKDVTGKEWNMIDLQDMWIDIPNRIPGEVYNIRVTAYNQLAEGPPSETFTIELGAVPDKMDAPMVSSMDSACEIRWEPPEENGHTISNYAVYFIDEKGFPILLDLVDGGDTSYIADGLLNGVEYSFRISALNKKGEGEMSAPASAAPMRMPDAPGELYLVSSGDQYAKIAWTEPVSNGGSAILGYNIYRGVSEGAETKIATISGDVFTFTDDGLQNGRTYHYLVSAHNEIGEGGYSNGIFASPLATPSYPLEFALSATTDTVTIEWVEPADDGGTEVTGYVLYKGTSRSDMNLLLYLGPEERSFTDEDVSEGTYYYSVHAYNKQGMGEPAYDEVDVPARIPTAVIIGILAFLIPLIIGILAVVIPLLSARSKKKKEKLSREAPERTEEEKRKEQSMKAAVPGLPGTMQQRSGAPQLGQPRQAPIERVLPPAQHQYQQQQPAQQQPIAQQPFQQQYPRQQPVHQASPGEATATPSQPQMRAAPPLDMERLMDEKDARDKGETTEQKNMDPRGQR